MRILQTLKLVKKKKKLTYSQGPKITGAIKPYMSVPPAFGVSIQEFSISLWWKIISKRFLLLIAPREQVNGETAYSTNKCIVGMRNSTRYAVKQCIPLLTF